MAQCVTPSQIINGLLADPRYPYWSHLSMVKDQVARLPEIVEPARMAEKVTYRGIMQLYADMLGDLLRRGVSPDPTGRITRQLRGIRAGFLTAIHLYGSDYDDHEPVVYPNSFRLEPAVFADYLDGKLTYADLLRRQPGILVPNYNPETETFLPGYEA